MKHASLIFSYLIITSIILFAQHQEIDTVLQNQNKITFHQEGFTAGTLIKTSHSDVPITFNSKTGLCRLPVQQVGKIWKN